MLAAILDPFDRVLEAVRSKGDQKVLRIKVAANAESAADVAFDVIHRVLGQLHHRGHRALVEERELAAPDIVSR